MTDAHIAAPRSAARRTKRLLVIAYSIAIGLIALLVWLGIARHDNPNRYFGEGRPGTTATVIAFLIGAIGALQIRSLLRPDRFAWFWLIAAVGLALLAIDEQFKGHETLDHLVNNMFGRDPEGEWDELDDLIVMSYGPLAAIVALPFAKRLLRLRAMVVILAVGFVCFVVMAVLDSSELDEHERLGHVAGAFEESFKLLSAVSIMAAIIAAKYRLEEDATAGDASAA